MDHETQVTTQNVDNHDDSLRSVTPKAMGLRVVEVNANEMLSGLTGGHQQFAENQLMPGDAESHMAPGMPAGGSSDNNRRNSRRPAQSIDQPLPPPPTPVYHFPSTGSSYGQRSSFYGGGQYTMSPPPPAMAHAHHYPYPHGHGFRVPADPVMISQNIHANYQHMMTAPYPYQQQRQSPESNSPPHSQGGFSNPNLYSPQGQHTNPSPSPTFTNPGQFQSLQYPSPISHSTYTGYQTQAPYSYQPPQYNYPQLFGSADPEGQGTWWYLPVTPHQPQYDSTHPPLSYQAPPFPMAYSPLNHQPQRQEMERLGSNSPMHMYPNNPASSPSPHPPPQTHTLHPPHPSRPPPPPTSPSSSTPPDQPPKPAPPPTGRRPYHPSPPPHRSEWVMWTGNVPPDATHDELWRFFTQKPITPPTQSPPLSSDHQPLVSSLNSSQVRSTSSLPGSDNTKWISGVVSIFLISRSSCAFVNYDGISTLESAIRKFNGLPLRPHDPRCPRLVCRVRKQDDDLRAGVGGQRGVGMHMRYVKDTKQPSGRGRNRKEDDSNSSAPTTASSSALTTSEENSENSVGGDGTVDLGAGGVSVGQRSIPRAIGSNSSGGSYASTNSSLLMKYFPKRFFILKSLSQYDLDLSVEKGLWATQKHNEGILDQAYRTSLEVYLIFGVNKSGEFYGYARMAGPVKGEHQVSWGPRSDSASSVSTRSSLSPVTRRGSVQTDTIFEEPPASPTYELEGSFGDLGTGTPSSASDHQFFPGHMVDESPQPFTGGPSTSASMTNPLVRPSAVGPTSAPAELTHHHKKFTLQTPVMKFSLNLPKEMVRPASATGKSIPTMPRIVQKDFVQKDFQLDKEAPGRAVKNPSNSSSEESLLGGGADLVDGRAGKGKGKQTSLPTASRSSPPPTMPPPRTGKERERERDESWGDSFRVEWIRTDKLPFYRTRHIRNPWNHDKEVKVSRDGTELEPGVGQLLIDEWEMYLQEKEKEREKEREGERGMGVGGIGVSITDEDAGVEGKPKPTPSVASSSTRKPVAGTKRNG